MRVRPEFDVIDNFDWIKWIELIRKQQKIYKKDMATLLGWPKNRYLLWTYGHQLIGIENFTEILEVFGFRFVVFTGDYYTLDWFMKVHREGVRPFGNEPLILGDEYADFRSFLRLIRNKRNISLTYIEHLFKMFRGQLWKYESLPGYPLDFRIYMKILIYLEVRFAFIKGSIISSGDPELFGVDNFYNNEYHIRNSGNKGKIQGTDEGPAPTRIFSRWEDPGW